MSARRSTCAFPNQHRPFTSITRWSTSAKGGWGLLLGQMTKQAARILEKIRRGAHRRPAGRPAIDRRMALDLHQQRDRPRAVPQSLRSDLRLQFGRTAGARLSHLFREQGRVQTFGFSPTGTIGAWNALADATIRLGGEVWLSSSAERIEIEMARSRGWL